MSFCFLTIFDGRATLRLVLIWYLICRFKLAPYVNLRERDTSDDASGLSDLRVSVVAMRGVVCAHNRGLLFQVHRHL